MSQEPYWQHRLPREIPENEAATALRDGMYDQAPRIWPFNPPTSYGVAAPGLAPFVPNMLPLNTGSQSLWPSFAASPHSPEAYPIQYAHMSPQYHRQIIPFQMGVNIGNNSSPLMKNFPAHSPIPTFTVPSDANAGQKRSRLPPDSTGRKMPQKAGGGSRNHAPTTKRIPSAKVKSRVISGRIAKPEVEHKRDNKQLLSSHNKVTKRDTPKSRRAAQPKRTNATSNNHNNAATATVQHSRAVEDEHDDESDTPLRIVRTRRVIKELDESTKPVQPTIETEDVICRAQGLSQTPQIHEHEHVEATSIIAPLKHQPLGPRPRCQYEVPEALKGVQKAMGPDNWNEYVVLLEKLWAREIHGEDFAAASKVIFMIFDHNMRRKINISMLRDMITPTLEKYMAEKKQADEGQADEGQADEGQADEGQADEGRTDKEGAEKEEVQGKDKGQKKKD
ncbi:hypothetical protein T440DRAFT_466691 [Plenodomus tracheiphilus IPT5]|uniref:Uncharacterized protein n=1 Tax=Plenodomus tracheiphilus IPT5 TaxID=1408161 RepID=A0A6A7BBA6_9PLEO|nr:hypothetical protein T440DRAFT_466691 [Plenodomus tracheiphilus IPT5]